MLGGPQLEQPFDYSGGVAEVSFFAAGSKLLEAKKRKNTALQLSS
jgi:hypothetical protein